MKLIFSKSIHSLPELNLIASEVKKALSVNSILLLSGDLGAGKTTFVSYFCSEFLIQYVQSPTYAIHHRYNSSEVSIDHFDLYRLETEEQIQSAGIYDLLEASADYKIIEWPQRIAIENYPAQRKLFKLEITILDENSRKIELFSLN